MYLKISDKRRYIKWKITNYSTPVRRALCSKPTQKFVQTLCAQQLEFTAYIFVANMAHVYSVTQAWHP